MSNFPTLSPFLALNHFPKSPTPCTTAPPCPSVAQATSLVSSRSHTNVSLLLCTSCLTPLSLTLCLASPLSSGLRVGLSLLHLLPIFRCPAVFLTLSKRLQERFSRPLVPHCPAPTFASPPPCRPILPTGAPYRSSRVHVSLPIGTVPLVLLPYPLSFMLSRLILFNTSRASRPR
jgi:hypothetical protein